MHGKIIAYIEPSVLKWARERITATSNIVSQKTGIKESKLLEWEEGKSYPSFTQLRKLAKFYNLHLSVFFLPKPPLYKKTGSINLRRFVGVVHEKLNVDTNRFLIECSDKRELIREIYKYKYENKIVNLVKSFSDVKSTAIKIREMLCLSPPSKKRENRIWFNELREKIDNLGILVFQTNRYVDLGGIRGIAIYEKEFPLIILDKRDSYGAKSFTLVHELIHLMCEHDDVFNEGRNLLNPEHDNFEIWVNSVTSEVLVFDNNFWVLYNEKWNSNLSVYMNCNNLSGYFGVSSEVIALKLLKHECIQNEEYNNVKDECKKRASKKKKSGRNIPHYSCLNENGRFFVKSVLSKHAEGDYTTLEACSYLGLKYNSFNKLLAYIR